MKSQLSSSFCRALGVATILSAFLLAGCGKPTAAGYWEGKGKSQEILMNDHYRHFTRSADYDFWFQVDKSGNAVGQIDIIYDALLKVENLPKASAGIASFAPEVGGKMTDLDPKRRFDLVGFFDGQKLALELATPEAQRKSLEFSFRADPGVSASLGVGPMTVPSGKLGDAVTVMKMQMMPFSPFLSPGKVEKRPGGPFVASIDEHSDKYAINWTTHQAGGEQRDVKITPEMRDSIEKLKKQLEANH
ncbi:MAG TPA: hypothetical protein VN176_06310 [Verrucomicrobiae bacterium]|jgi:hypothetical protein|nr:hypothetical protein [Verrucomicrobiae bacterium]